MEEGVKALLLTRDAFRRGSNYHNASFSWNGTLVDNGQISDLNLFKEFMSQAKVFDIEALYVGFTDRVFFGMFDSNSTYFDGPYTLNNDSYVSILTYFGGPDDASCENMTSNCCG